MTYINYNNVVKDSYFYLNRYPYIPRKKFKLSLTTILCEQHIKRVYGCSRLEFVYKYKYSLSVLLNYLEINNKQDMLEYTKFIGINGISESYYSLEYSVLMSYLDNKIENISIPVGINDDKLWLLISSGSINYN